MKKVFLLFVILATAYNAFAQEGANLPQREIQIEIGEAQNILPISNIYKYSNIMGDTTSIQRALSPVLAITHHRQINPKWWYGVSVAYYNLSQRATGKDNNVLYYSETKANEFAIIPSVKFSYCNKDWLQMYSGLQAGMSFAFGKTTYSTGNVSSGSSLSFFGQLTAFGINYGKDFYIGAEIGFGHKGVLNFVAGYRF